MMEASLTVGASRGNDRGDSVFNAENADDIFGPAGALVQRIWTPVLAAVVAFVNAPGCVRVPGVEAVLPTDGPPFRRSLLWGCRAVYLDQ